jgi:hypothetical protein
VVGAIEAAAFARPACLSSDVNRCDERARPINDERAAGGFMRQGRLGTAKGWPNFLMRK